MAWMVFGVYVGIHCLFLQPGADAKSKKELLRLIRIECDEMTRRCTPFLSFHVCHAATGTISHIDVNISKSATPSGVATTSNAIMEPTNNYSKIDESSDNHHPVIHGAQAETTLTATNSDYQQLDDVI
jgi:hypothetical protein